MIGYLFWIAYCITDGLKDGFFYHLKDPNKSTKPNEHTIFTIQRALIGLVLYYTTNADLWCILAYALSQPFIHNTIYYNTRRALGYFGYEWGFMNQSTTSTALTTKIFTPWVRIILFIISLIIIWLRSQGLC